MTGLAMVIACRPSAALASVTTTATSLELSPIVTIAPGALGALASSGSTSAWSDDHCRSSFFGSMPAGTASVTVVVHWPSAVSVHGVAASNDVVPACAIGAFVPVVFVKPDGGDVV